MIHSRAKSTRLGKSPSPRLNSSLGCGYVPPAARATAEDTEPRGWAVGRLSMMLLLFVTFTDVVFRGVNDQMSQIESHEDYDALSPDVIRPAFIYKSAMNMDKPSLGLGSAALASITDALSPILPFTGGVDLRRSEYYTSGNLIQNIYALIEKTSEADSNARLDNEESATTTMNDVGETSKRKSAVSKKDKKKHPLVLGAPTPFVSHDMIAQLTLEDVGVIFEYVTLSETEGFNPTKYQSRKLPRVKKVLQALVFCRIKSLRFT